MKIILSRKGFDSSAGGWPSPILPDGRLLSLPIPDDNGNISYSMLNNGDSNYFEIMSQLSKNLKLGKRKFAIDANTKCHLDPDIDKTILPRSPEWRGIFGQTGNSQSHLQSNNVGIGDLFLFFGWFKNTKMNNGKLIFDPSDEFGRHIIYGYLEVGDIIQLGSRRAYDTYCRDSWMAYHPHCLENRLERGKNDANNTLYIAREKFSLDNRLNGYGTFKFDEKLVLTKKGAKRSKWILPDCFRQVSITYHKNAWKDDYFQSVGRGQEFVVDENIAITDWAKKLIQSHFRSNI